MNVGFHFDAERLRAELDALVEEIAKSLPALAEKTKEAVLKEVLDHGNWLKYDSEHRARAKYKLGPQAGQAYDLAFTGQFLASIRQHVLEEVTKDGFIVGIGDIAKLDSMGSRASDSSYPYWRVLVWGRGPIPGRYVYWNGEIHPMNPSKPRIGIADHPSKEIGPQAGTHLFEEGWKAARNKVQRLFNKAVYDAAKRASQPWK